MTRMQNRRFARRSPVRKSALFLLIGSGLLAFWFFSTPAYRSGVMTGLFHSIGYLIARAGTLHQ